MNEGRACFPPDARLHVPAEFQQVFATGRKEVTAGLVVIYAPGGASMSRLGLALAKRRIKRAVDRNRVKRVVRESFRRARLSLPAADVVVLARSATAGMSNDDLALQLHGVWPRISSRIAAMPVLNSGEHDPAGQGRVIHDDTPASSQGIP